MYASPRATPTMKRKKGMTKSATVTPSHGEWFSAGMNAPASSTMIISCNREKKRLVYFCLNLFKSSALFFNENDREPVQHQSSFITDKYRWLKPKASTSKI